jgi:hypothetical protein
MLRCRCCNERRADCAAPSGMISGLAGDQSRMGELISRGAYRSALNVSLYREADAIVGPLLPWKRALPATLPSK